MKYKVQTSFFMGAGAHNTTIAEYDDPEEALSHIKNNPPPSEHDWNILGPDGHAYAFTQYSGELIHVWRPQHELMNATYATKDWIEHKKLEVERYEQWKREHGTV